MYIILQKITIRKRKKNKDQFKDGLSRDTGNIGYSRCRTKSKINQPPAENQWALCINHDSFGRYK